MRNANDRKTRASHFQAQADNARAFEGTMDPIPGDALVEHRFDCPYCWESITMLVDPTAADQQYVEDCEVCCNPIELHVRAAGGAVIHFDARQAP